jgi:predicted nucleotidyltransferase
LATSTRKTLADLLDRLIEFEIIDIIGTGNNSLTFTRLDVLNLLYTSNRLIANGNAGDKSTEQGWTTGGTTTLNGILYNRYMVGEAILLVDADIT